MRSPPSGSGRTNRSKARWQSSTAFAPPDTEPSSCRDNVQERIDYLEETCGFLHRFAGGVLSHLAGLRKPDPKIYELALEKASCAAAQCVYVDDKPAMLEPAMRMGMSAIPFENPGQLERDLQSLGLVF